MSEATEATKLVPKLSPVKSATTPRLRFPRHSTPWQRIALKEFLTEPPSYGLNAPATKYRANLPLYLRITDIDESGRYLRDGRVSVAQAVTSDAYLEQGDIAVARTGASVGKSYFCDGRDGPFVYAGFLIRLRANPNKLLPSLLAQWLRSDEYWRWITLTSARSGQPGINGTEYASTAMPMPTGPLALEEQRKIAECLESLDELIAAETERMETLKRHKKGLLQQLFPAEGETTPRLRFPQFRDKDDWKKTVLGELVAISSGGTPSKANNAYWNGDVPWISAESMHHLRVSDSFVRISRAAVAGGAALAPKGSLLILTRGSMLFRRVPICIAERQVAFNQDVKCMRPMDIDTEFLLYFLLAIESTIPIDKTGIGAGKIGTDELKNIALSVPDKIEQATVATTFVELERCIDSSALVITSLRTHKAALMQQLFPSLEELDAATA